MACLIGFLNDSDGRPVRDKLEEAYRAVAEAYLHSLRPLAPTGRSLTELIRVVNEHGAVVNLRPARARCEFVCGGEMDAGEVRIQLRQVEVLMAACDLLARIGLRPSQSCPTQGSTDSTGTRVEDLEGPGFVVDGFGGDDITNNSKAATILATLAAARSAEPSRRTFIAMRRRALVRNTSEHPGWRNGGHVRARHAREKWVAEADVILREEDDDDLYVLVEVDGITVMRATPQAAQAVPV